MGFAAAAGFRAADLAQAGLAGPAAWLTGPSGFLALTEPKHDLAPGLAALGMDWQVERLSHKPFPSGRLTHPAIDGVQRILAGGAIDPERVQGVRLLLPPLAMRLVGRPLVPGLSANYARLCLPYVVAATLRFGSVGLDDFTPARLADPLTLALAARVAMLADGSTDENAVVPQVIEMVMQDATTRRVVVEATIGSPANPLDDAAQMAKAWACAASARQPMGPARLQEVAALVANLMTMPDAAVLGRALRPG
jgi:2-methylcitrate dehydratase PrpD